MARRRSNENNFSVGQLAELLGTGAVSLKKLLIKVIKQMFTEEKALICSIRTTSGLPATQGESGTIFQQNQKNAVYKLVL